MVTMVRRFLLLTALVFWQGGFTFYGAVVVPIGSEILGSQMFRTLVYAAIERRWNKTPPFEIVPPSPRKKNGGKKYQARCLEILQWLHAEGDIKTLDVSEES
jgi:hypothetical protein